MRTHILKSVTRRGQGPTCDIMFGPDGSPHVWEFFAERVPAEHAQVVAAAPELLEILQTLAGTFDSVRDYPGVRELLRKASAAK